MFKYQGASCPYCQKELTEQDELVICPECGAPYHKACAQQSGGCVLTDLHACGKHWEAPQAEIPNPETVDGMASLRCSRCGTLNPAGGLFCEVCGHELNRSETEEPKEQQPKTWFQEMSYNPFTTPFGGLGADETIDGVSVKDLAIYVGQNSHYFLPKFRDIKVYKRTWTMNWSAFFFDFYYLIYRKMWGFALLFLAVSSLLNAPSLLVSLDSILVMLGGESASILEQWGFDYNILLMLTNFCSFLSLGLKFVMAATANRVYCAKAFRDIRAMQKLSGEGTDSAARFSKKGGVSMIALIVSLILTVIVSSTGSVLLVSTLIAPYL